jgi:hypothetical protein
MQHGSTSERRTNQANHFMPPLAVWTWRAPLNLVGQKIEVHEISLLSDTQRLQNRGRSKYRQTFEAETTLKGMVTTHHVIFVGKPGLFDAPDLLSEIACLLPSVQISKAARHSGMCIRGQTSISSVRTPPVWQLLPRAENDKGQTWKR